jgi:ferric-dicitrate binding protein FerR (iron transport regulator)
MMEDKAKKLLEKYLEGTATPGEIKHIDDWYAELNAGKTDVPNVRKFAIREQMLQNVRSAVAAKKISRSLLSSHWLRIAAAIAVVTSVMFTLWKFNDRHDPASTWVTTSAKAGERLKIGPGDGSVITLEPLTRVSYPSRFGGDSRQIKLIEGEAFFSVSHDEARPFQVELPSDLHVKVLGTSFRIRSYQDKNQVEVAVATGKVAVNNKGKLVGMLTRNQQLLFNRLTGKSQIHVAKKGEPVMIAFNGATLDQVIQRMEYVYNIKISLEDRSLSGLKSTATFSSAQRPEEILDIICSLHRIRSISDKNHKTFKLYK